MIEECSHERDELFHETKVDFSRTTHNGVCKEVEMHEILNKLRGGDRRSIGRANEVVEGVFRDPSLFGDVFEGMLSENPLIRMRAADVVEKVTVRYPRYLDPYKEILLQQVVQSEQQEVRWHVAQLIPRLHLNQHERLLLFDVLRHYLTDASNIVKTFSMQALADLAEQDSSLRQEVLRILEVQTKIGSPAVKNRGNKLIQKLSGR